MTDPIEIGGFLLLLALLAAWALRQRADRRHDATEREHQLRRRVISHIDRWEEGRYRHDLRVDLALADLLDDDGTAGEAVAA